MLTIIITAVVMCYLLAAGIQYVGLTSRVADNKRRRLFLFLSYLAVILHGYLLYRWIDQIGGQNLSFFNMFSFASWLIGIFVLLASVRRPLETLCIFIFPIAAASTVLLYFFSGHQLLNTATHPKQLLHILTAAAAFSMLCIAALQALLLAFQEYLLRRKYAGLIIKKLPPLETMEHLLFQMIWLGFLLLSVVLITSVYFFPHPFMQPLLQKTFLTLITWLIFAILLAGRYFFGWRGRKVVYYTLSGVLLLVVVYFGSELYFFRHS